MAGDNGSSNGREHLFAEAEAAGASEVLEPVVTAQAGQARVVKGGVALVTAGDGAALSKSGALVMVVQGDVTLTQSGAFLMVAGRDIRISEGGAMAVVADGNVDLSDGALLIVSDGSVQLTNGGAGLVLAGSDATVRNGGMGVLHAGRDVRIRNGGAGLVVAGGDVTITRRGEAHPDDPGRREAHDGDRHSAIPPGGDPSRGAMPGSAVPAVVVAAGRANVENASIGLLLAGRVELHGSRVLFSISVPSQLNRAAGAALDAGLRLADRALALLEP